MASGNELITVVENVDEVRMEIQGALREKYLKLSAFTDGKVWDKNRYIEFARLKLQEHVVSGVAAGKALIVLKEMLPHGEFTESLQEIGIHERTARNYMRVASVFAGMDPDTVAQLGMTKLYAVIKAPAEEIERFVNDGTMLGREKDDLVQMSAKEIEQLVKDATEKIKLSLEETRIKTDQLSEELGHLKKEKRQLEKQLADTKAGAPPEEKLPEYWNEYTAVLSALTAFSAKLAQCPNDFDDEKVVARCEVIRQRIEHEWAHCRKFIVNLPIDPVEHLNATQENLHRIKKSGKFDFSKLEE